MMSDVEIRTLEDDHLEALVKIRRFSFLDTTDYADPGQRARLRRRMRHMSGVFRDGELVAAGAMLPFRMFYEGEPIEVGGLASVVSEPAQRRRGHVRRLLGRMLEELHEAGVGWCLEYPFDSRYYARFGWQTIPTGLVVEAPVEQFDRDDVAFEGERPEPGAPETIERLRKTWAAYGPRHNFAMTRDGAARPDWKRIVEGDPWEPRTRRVRRFTFVDEDSYCVVRVDRRDSGEQVALVVDWAYASLDGRRRIFALLATLRGQVHRVRIQFPFEDPLLLELTRFAVAHPNPLQARVVDVESALRSIAGRVSRPVTFGVRDEFCPWNERTFELGGGDVVVTDDTADLVVDVRTLALVLAGSRIDPATGEGRSLRQLLDGAVQRRPYMPLSDYF